MAPSASAGCILDSMVMDSMGNAGTCTGGTTVTASITGEATPSCSYDVSVVRVACSQDAAATGSYMTSMSLADYMAKSSMHWMAGSCAASTGLGGGHGLLGQGMYNAVLHAQYKGMAAAVKLIHPAVWAAWAQSLTATHGSLTW